MTHATWSTLHAGESREYESPVTEQATISPESFATLYRQHYAAIAGYLYRRTGNQALAEDLAADTFLSAWKALPSYRSTGVSFRSWLLRIATNRANAHARREAVRRRIWLRLPKPTSTSAIEDPAEELYPAFIKLAAPQQAVLALVHLEGLSVEQAARVLDLPPGTVKSRLHRARAALKHELARIGGDA